MEKKTLYQFTLDKETETIVESTRKNKKTGEETITKRKKKVKQPVEVQVKRPNRRELEEAELIYSIEMSKCVKSGILTKAMLGKKYSDVGGVFSQEDSENYASLYKDALDLQNEYTRLSTIKKKTKAQENRLSTVTGEMAVNRKSIIDFESNFQSLFDHTADVKAQNKILLWYCLHLTYVYDEEKDKFVEYFEGDDFEEKTKFYYELEESEDQFYWELVSKITTVIAFWYFNQASSQEDFEDLIKKVESGELTGDLESEDA
jgi:hypothetical protein